MADIVKDIFPRLILLADKATASAERAQAFKQECLDLKHRTFTLARLLRTAARKSTDLYERPTRRIVHDTEQVLDNALALLVKCGASGIVKRMFNTIPAVEFRKTAIQLENSIGNVYWLLRLRDLASSDGDDEHLGLAPIAANAPTLCLIWEKVTILYSGSLEDRSDAAASLVCLARGNVRCGKLIIEEGGVPPLLKLAEDGDMEGQENAARAIGLLASDPESVEQIVNAGVCTVFAKLLKEGPVEVHPVVAWAVSELAANHPKCCIDKLDQFGVLSLISFLVV